MSNFQLEIENATASYDGTTRIVTITYRGVLDSAVTIIVYNWLDNLYKAVGIDAIYGEIFDFSGVKSFDEGNLTTARRTSNRMNMSQDTSQFPVALVVANHEQEEILRGPMRIPEGHQRKRIVRSTEEALQFFQTWNQEK
jgi:hypothetical protein